MKQQLWSFQRGRIPPYAPNGKMLGKQSQHCTGNQLQNYSTAKNNGFYRANGNYKGGNNRYI